MLVRTWSSVHIGHFQKQCACCQHLLLVGAILVQHDCVSIGHIGLYLAILVNKCAQYKYIGGELVDSSALTPHYN